ncbi:MAG: LTA synthase family protein [Rickettsiaceae bacterium]|nr:MAG: LTA synthase family protein [Rickettsiaceae bacterium]
MSIIRIFCVFQLITRIALCAYGLLEQQILLINLPQIFVIGFLNDLIASCYLVPLIYIFHLIFINLSNTVFINYINNSWRLIFISLLMTNLLAELAFWDEFGTKYNFIAVDYLIYTQEIIGTLKESFPLYKIILLVIIISALVNYLLNKFTVISNKESGSKIILKTVSSFIICVLINNYYNYEITNIDSNRYANELGQNGPYQFINAFFNNSLNYDRFYPKIDKTRALELVRTRLNQDNIHFLSSTGVDRVITAKNNAIEQKKYNVIFIVVESLSAEFMNKFGNDANITPNLDKLADESIFFTNLYATGTRTVRGLEAISLSIPPMPGSSVIRRTNNHNLFNISNEFTKQGYEVNFIYGGFSYFDNLKSFFNGNQYKVIDRADLSKEEISFSNIWGVADEDILLKSIKIANENHNKSKPFFSLIMTTSNHRPYTFPNGRIDLPSGTGRYPAVKYTDYSIGKFISEAKKQPWFEDTIIVITADHCASSAGKTQLPINKYHIPLIVYAPKLLKPRVIDNLASQIDIAPTIFGILNLTYQSKFFGSDIINYPANRAYISTYQLLGFMKNDHLVILSPNNSPQTYKLGSQNTISADIPYLIEEAISFYMTTDNLYNENKFKNLGSNDNTN